VKYPTIWAFLADFSIRGRLWIRRFHFWLLVQTFLKASKAPAFKAGATLKAAVNSGKK
jgi:hypothetical protein